MTARDAMLARLAPLRILASAGSGKTYQLAGRYLELLAAGAAPSSMLATTFTRAAAGEIRDRVLMELAGAVISNEKREKLRDRLGLGALSADQAGALLRTLVDDLHRLQIRTLDSFFASIVLSFGLELGAPPGSDVIDEEAAAALRAEAIRLMLDEQQPQRLIDLLRQLTNDEASRSVTESIDSAIRAMEALHREAPPEAWDHLHGPDPLKPAAVTAAMQRIEALDRSGLKDSMNKAIACDLANATKADWESFLLKGISAKIALGEGRYSRMEITADLIAAYRPLVNHALAVIRRRLHNQTLATRDLLSIYATQHDTLKRRRKAITFDDLTGMVCRAMRMDPLNEIAFRLDATLHHLLLDEMQDTSIPQWHALEPIAKEIVSYAPPDRTFFCVGDVKQSIYAWREASPEVLEAIPDLLGGPDGTSAIRTEQLARSYRSSPDIMGLVNQTFQKLEGNPAMVDWPSVAQAWDRAFVKHESADELKNLKGYAELLVAPVAAKGQKQANVRLAHVAKLVEKLHRQSPQRSIAVLTRSNDAVARLLYELGPSRLDLPVGARGGGSLIDTSPVNAVLDLFRMADHPDDTISAFHVAHSPLGAIAGLANFADAAQRQRVSRHVRQSVLRDGYAGTLAPWVAKLALSCDERELRRLAQLVSLAQQHDGSPTLRCDDFVRLVESKRVADVRAAPIQVMVIHQSKGLEFDIVVLAQLEDRLAGRNREPCVVERDGPTGPPKRICRRLGSKLLPLFPDVAEIHGQAERRRVRESLNVLYVAMTRARQAVIMVIDPPPENQKTHPKTMAGVLRGALVREDLKAVTKAMTLGDADWHQRPSTDKTDEPATPPTIGAIRLRPLSRGRSAKVSAVRSPSASAAAEATMAQLLEWRDPESTERGSTIHRLFQEILWLEQFSANDDSLLKIVGAIAPRRDVAWHRALVGSFRRMLAHQAVKDSLSLGTRDPALVTVWRERPFARLVDEGIQQGAIDRVEIERAGDAIRTVRIFDFKTDRVEAAQAAGHAQGYRPQMEAYRDAVAQMLAVEPGLIRLTVLMVHAGVEVELG